MCTHAVALFWRAQELSFCYFSQIMLGLKLCIVATLLPNSLQNELLSCLKNNDHCTKGFKILNVEKQLSCNCTIPSFNELPYATENKWKFICSTGHSIFFKVKNHDKNYGDLVLYNKPTVEHQFLILTNATHISIDGLQPGISYNFKFIEIGYENTFISVESTIASTFGSIEVPDTISNITILEWESAGRFLNVKMEWSPGIRSTCHFDFFWQSDLSMNMKEIRNAENLYTILVEDLMYDHNYTILVRSVYNKFDTESAPFTYILKTPLCSMLNKKNSSLFCLPEKLEGVKVDEIAVAEKLNDTCFYDVIIQWNLPLILPDRVHIQLKNYDLQDNMIIKREVHGNVTSALISNISLGKTYKIKVSAASSVGMGPPIEFLRQIKQEHFDTFSRVEIFIIFMITLIIATTIIIGVFYTMNRWKKVKRTNKDTRMGKIVTNRMEVMEDFDRSLELFTDIFEVPRSSIIFSGILGEGAFGVVKKGILNHNGCNKEVAVKTLKDKHSEEEKEQLIQEIKMLQAIGQHNHVVSMLACVTKCAVEEMLLIVELCAFGDLLNYLQSIKLLLLSERKQFIYENENRKPLNGAFANKLYDAFSESEHCFGQCKTSKSGMRDLVSFAKQVADGMEFLSGNRIIHRDLAARNVLVTSEYILKISDFGLSRDIYQNNCYVKTSHGKVPIKWMAIESLLSHKYTTQSDVELDVFSWSFGVLLWEIMTYGSTPYMDESPSQLIDFLCSGRRLSRPENTSPALYAIMLSCWNFKSCDRPRFSHLKDALDDILLNDDFFKKLPLEY